MKKLIHYFLVIVITLMIGCGSEQSDFNKAKLENSVASYERFLAKHRNTIFSDSAMTNLYRLVSDSSNIDLYYQFITKHQYSNLADSAKNKLYFLLSKQDSLDLFKAFAKSFPDYAYADSAIIRVFSLTCQKNKEELYKQFIADNPNNSLADSAIAQIYFLRKEKKSKSAYLAFIAEYPKSRYVTAAKHQIERFDLAEVLALYIKEGEVALSNQRQEKKYSSEELKKFFYNHKYILGGQYRQHASRLGVDLPNDLFIHSSYNYYSYSFVNSAESQIATNWFVIMQNVYNVQDIDESTIEWINFIGLAMQHCRENYSDNSFQSNINRGVMAPMHLDKALELVFVHKNDPLIFVLTNAVLDMLIEHKNMTSDTTKEQLIKLKSELNDPFLSDKINKII